jgi:hypothetical protein
MMAYLDNFVVAIRKADTREVLRDVKGRNGERDVFLPFGSEYEIYVKNKSLYNVGAQVFIDGMDAFGGQKIAVMAGESTVLKRFMVDGDKDKGKRFKFVSVESGHEGIVNPDSRDNGLIQVKFYKEKERAKKTPDPVFIPYPVYPQPYPVYPWFPSYPDPYWDYPRERRTWCSTSTGDATLYKNNSTFSCDSKVSDHVHIRKPKTSGGIIMSNNANHSSGSMSFQCASSGNQPELTLGIGGIHDNGFCDDSDCLMDSDATSSQYCGVHATTPMSKVGTTVEGSVSSQSFREIVMECESEPVVTIAIRLKGNVSKALGVKDHIHCAACGVKVQLNAKFCWGCGAAVLISPCCR